MFHLILADSELETVPEEISSDKSLQRKARKRGRRAKELILDSNFYHRPMKRLEDSERRGRPDIIHVCMLAALDSPLNREGLLDFSVHTRNDEVLEIDPETRVPRSFNRFTGLMEQLFLTGGVPPDDPLIRLENMTLEEKIREIDPDMTIALSKRGEGTSREELFGRIEVDDDFCVIVGGFPHGEFRSDVETLSDRIVRIYPEGLDAITALTHVLQFYEEEYSPSTIFSGK